ALVGIRPGTPALGVVFQEQAQILAGTAQLPGTRLYRRQVFFHRIEVQPEAEAANAPTDQANTGEPAHSPTNPSEGVRGDDAPRIAVPIDRNRQECTDLEPCPLRRCASLGCDPICHDAAGPAPG